MAATFDDGNIRVIVPMPVAKQWIGSDQTGIEATAGTLRVLIEKDFQCLHREPEPGKTRFRIHWHLPESGFSFDIL